MDEFLAEQSAAVLQAHAEGLRVSSDAFATGDITFVEREAEVSWRYVARAYTAPGGSVVSVAPGLLSFAKEHRPHHHYSVTDPAFLGQLASEAQSADSGVSAGYQSICWALRSVPSETHLPTGLHFEIRDAAWMNAEQPNMRFENGVGEPGFASRSLRNKYAIVILDEVGEPIAVAGVFDTFGLDEIGVDVLRERRGARLGTSVVSAAVHAILERGGTPFYGCGAANIRSQRTAYSVGFVPVLTDAVVGA